MAIEPDYNIVVIGMGNIGKFLLPGYRKLLGDKTATNVFGIGRTPANVAIAQKAVPFKVSASNTLEVLREKHPDIVIVAVPPKAIPSVIDNELRTYFTEARSKGRSLPDIYTFGPSPSPQLYLDVLGSDVLAVKLLPSMVKEKKGIPLQKSAAGFVCFAGQFPEDRQKRALEFSDMFSKSFVVTHEQSLYGLSSKITAYSISDCVCGIADALKEDGVVATIADIASAWRAAFRKHVGLDGSGIHPCSETSVSETVYGFVSRLSAAWYDGILSYILSQGCGKETAEGFHNANFEALSLSAQLSSTEELEEDMKRRATKGGVTEKGVSTFRSYFVSNLRQAVHSWMKGTLEESFFDTAEGIAYSIDMTVNRHAYRLANK